VKEQNINHLKGRDPEKCVCKCEKGLHGQHILHHKYTKWHTLQILLSYLQKCV